MTKNFSSKGHNKIPIRLFSVPDTALSVEIVSCRTSAADAHTENS